MWNTIAAQESLLLCSPNLRNVADLGIFIRKPPKDMQTESS